MATSAKTCSVLRHGTGSDLNLILWRLPRDQGVTDLCAGAGDGAGEVAVWLVPLLEMPGLPVLLSTLSPTLSACPLK